MAQKAFRAQQKSLQDTKEQHDRKIAEKVIRTLATPGMQQKCRQSIATGSQACKDLVKLVRTFPGQGRPDDLLCYVDMEDVNEIPPYALTVCSQKMVKTWAFNPSPHGGKSTWDEFKVSLARAQALSLSFSLFLSRALSFLRAFFLCLSSSVARSFARAPSSSLFLFRAGQNARFTLNSKP